MSLTRCGFFLPWEITTATQIRLTLADSAVGATTVTATATADTYYNDLDVSGAALGDNLLRHLLDQLEAAETAAGTDGTYILTEVTGDYRGRYVISRTQGDAIDDVTSLEIVSGGEVTMVTFGFGAATATPASSTANPAVFTATNRAAGSWVLDPDHGLFAAYEPKGMDTVVSTTGPDGTTKRDVYGYTTRGTIELMTLPAASVFTHYSDQAAFCGFIGAPTGDDNAAFDELRRLWARIGDEVYCRFVPDVSTITTYYEIDPGQGDGWLSTLADVAEEVERDPLYFDLTLTFYVKG